MRERLAVASILVMGAIACSSPGSDALATADQNATGCSSPANETPSSPVQRDLSFAADVLPLFVKSCAFGSCHGSPKNAADNGIFLGSKSSAADARAIRASLVARPSTQSPSMPYVTASDPSRSYLYLKLTGDFCDLAECAGDRCGKPMPRGGDPLDPATLDLVRSWILQGAPE